MKIFNSKKQLPILILLIFFLIFIGWLGWNLISNQSTGFLSPLGKIEQGIKEKPLAKYSFENLNKLLETDEDLDTLLQAW